MLYKETKIIVKSMCIWKELSLISSTNHLALLLIFDLILIVKCLNEYNTEIILGI